MAKAKLMAKAPVGAFSWADGKTEKLAGLIRELDKRGLNTAGAAPAFQAGQQPAGQQPAGQQPAGQQPAGQPLRVLVAGCGFGLEALILAHELQAVVTGIDSRQALAVPAAVQAGEKMRGFPVALKKYGVCLKEGDATALEFADGSFDLVFSYHVLEHIPRYREALQEMSRVLCSGGAYLIGTPNRSRLLGYLGSKDIVTWRRKLRANWLDWRCRLRGKFRNECGAHAGFTRQELAAELKAVFRRVTDITPLYYERIYPRLIPCLRLLVRSGLAGFAFPALYFWGHK